MKRNLFDDIDITSFNDTVDFKADISKIKSRVLNEINTDSSRGERKVNIMTHKKKITLVAVCVALVLGITAFAATGMIKTWYSSSSLADAFYELPESENITKEIGYNIVLIEEFENGYVFERGNVIDNRLEDENSNTVEKFKSTSFEYKKDGDRVIYSQDKFESEVPFDGDKVAEENGVAMYYTSYRNKNVPGNYQMTKEDKVAEANGELVFSYGSSKVEIVTVQAISFEKDGIRHSLMQINGKLTKDELVEMAKEIINK
ncbi:MAG: hypothetical protein IJ316_03805 [Clostridia bacterium]|nr:hypothetical protein [Clostridia bacterium]